VLLDRQTARCEGRLDSLVSVLDGVGHDATAELRLLPHVLQQRERRAHRRDRGPHDHLIGAPIGSDPLICLSLGSAVMTA
jgi:hypothetical protein